MAMDMVALRQDVMTVDRYSIYRVNPRYGAFAVGVMSIRRKDALTPIHKT
jgi:hypothetical protein